MHPKLATEKPEPDVALEKVQRLVWGLTELLMGQRKINGRLQAAHEETIKVLKAIIERLDDVAPAQSAKKASSTNDSLKKIAEHAEYVGGDEPPGCQKPGGNP